VTSKASTVPADLNDHWGFAKDIILFQLQFYGKEGKFISHSRFVNLVITAWLDSNWLVLRAIMVQLREKLILFVRGCA